MPAIVVFIDHSGPDASGTLTKGSQELLSLARAAGEPVVALAGELAPELQEALAAYGATSILVSNQPELSEYLVAPKADFLAQAAVAVSAAAVLLENGTEGKDIAARVGVALSAGVVVDAVGLDASLVAEKSVLAGSYSVRCRATTPVAVIAVKPNSVDVSPAAAPSTPAVQELAAEFGPASLAVRVVDRARKRTSGRPELTDARIIVAGGRGLDGDFTPVEELADVLGAAVGASRAATDAGWIEHSYQVGQTGKTVSPQLYISAGISGAIQQKAGMQTSQVIVAVNKDADSPIFEIADFGIVGDLFKVLPQATEEIRRRKG